MILLLTNKWHCIGDGKTNHPRVENDTNKCPYCTRKRPLWFKFLSWLRVDSSYQLYDRKTIIWLLLSLTLSLFSYSLYHKIIQLETKNQNLSDQLIKSKNENADLSLIELNRYGSEQTVAYSNKWGINNDVINLNLNSGIYMIQVRLYRGSSTSYNLNITRQN